MTEDDEDSLELDDGYEEVIEFECPICGNRVSEEETECPGCGAIFVTQEEMEQEILEDMEEGEGADIELSFDDPAGDSIEDLELTEDYELDDSLDYADIDDDALEAEIAAMEAELADDGIDLTEYEDADDLVSEVEAVSELEVPELDLAYEEDLEVEEEYEAAFGSAVEVSAEDHDALEALAQPTLMDRMFQRTGISMFILGGILSVLIILYDPIRGEPLALGTSQLRVLVFALSMLIAGFAVEMFHAWSLSRQEDRAMAAAEA